MNWFKRTAAPTFQTDGSVSWESTEKTNFDVKLYIRKVQELKNIVFYNIDKAYRWPTVNVESDEQVGRYKIIRYRFDNIAPADIKAKLDSLMSGDYMKYVTTIEACHSTDTYSSLDNVLKVEADDGGMEDKIEWFNERTQAHIDKTRDYCNKINSYDPVRFKGIIERGETHDASKLEEPERTPYIYITDKYKCKRDGTKFEAPEGMEDKMNQASEHHVTNNSHHPESWSGKTKGIINKEDRDKPPKEAVDATNMPDLDIAEMVADWCAMSEELGNTKRMG